MAGIALAHQVRCGRGECVRISLLPLLASALSGVSAIFEKLSVVNLSGLTVLTLRSTLLLPVLWVALYVSGRHRELAGMAPRTFGTILLPAAMALGSLLLYFTALRGDWVSRVYPLPELGPAITVVPAVVFLGEPPSPQRLLGIVLIIAERVLVR
jgi:bacterial/archaeal transporter family protein